MLLNMMQCKYFNFLVQLGANPVQRDGDGRTPFYIAAEIGREDILKSPYV